MTTNVHVHMKHRNGLAITYKDILKQQE